MAGATKTPRRRSRAREPQEQVQDATDDATEKVEEQAPDVSADGGGEAPRQGLVRELRDAMSEAALEVLRPVAREATKSAAKYAVTKGPGMVKDRVGPMVMEAGGAGALAKGAKGALSKAGGITDKLPGGKGGGKRPSGHGRGRRLPVQEHIDVAVDLQTAYDQWTQFEEFPRFMHRVEKIEQKDETTLMWHENIWGVRRSWEAEIIDQQPCERIAWRSTGGTQTVGVVTFHRLSDRLTRIQINHDFQPQGLFEKTASGFRMSRRALRSDLMRFKAFIEMKDDATGAWRGRIEEGEVVDAEGEEEPEAEEREEPEAEEREEADEDEEREEPEAEYEDEESEEDEEPEAEYEEEEQEEEEEEEPERRPTRRRGATRTSRPAARRR